MSNNQYETGTSHFLDRFALTRRFEESLEGLLEDYAFQLMPFGQTALLQGNSWMSSRLRRIDTKSSLIAIMIKFSPDYVIYFKKGQGRLFFSDAKASITPVFFNSHINRIRMHSCMDILTRSHVGEIEREAWFSYNRFYPDVAIIMASPYSTKLVMAEWVKNIRCLWCFKGVINGTPQSWDCSECPIKTGQGFGVITNDLAGGSGTPHTNIDFGSMRTLPKFLLEEFGVDIDQNEYSHTILNYVKEWPLNKPQGRVSWDQYNGAIRELREEGCDWLKFRREEKFYNTYAEYRADNQR
jgi:hypothetical protein